MDMTDKLLVKIALVKHIVLIFSLFITAIILIFSLIKTAFLSIYENIAKRLAWYSKFENLKVLQKKLNREFMLEYEKKQNQILLSIVLNVYNIEVLKHFATKTYYSSKIFVNIQPFWFKKLCMKT